MTPDDFDDVERFEPDDGPLILNFADIHMAVGADGTVRFDCAALGLEDHREELRLVIENDDDIHTALPKARVPLPQEKGDSTTPVADGTVNANVELRPAPVPSFSEKGISAPRASLGSVLTGCAFVLAILYFLIQNCCD